MRGVLGDEAEALFRVLDTEPVTSIRLNPAKPSIGVDGEVVGWCTWGRYLAERPQFTLDPLLHGGAYYVQEASSQFVAHLLAGDNLAGCRILDMCAAPGGKSTIYSTLVGGEGLVVSNDISRSRALALSDNVQRWGMGNVVVTCNEPSHIGDFEHWFDVVAVDAPCSGEGMFRKMIEARTEWSASSPAQCAARQRDILIEAWRALRPGGKLIYSTCTFNPTEDEDMVSWMVETFGDELVAASQVDTPEEWGITRGEIGPVQHFHFYPHKARGEGFFAAVACKREGAVRRVTPKPRRRLFASLTKSDMAEATRWLSAPEEMSLRMVGDMIYGYHKSVVEDVRSLSENLSVLYSGVALGQIFKGRLKPEHALALYVGRSREVVPMVELSEEEAVGYLRRGDVVASHFEEGINIVSYRGVAIGFVKRIGARCNNMYPKDLRIMNL